MTQSKSDGENREDASLLLGLSTTKSTAPVTTAGRELDIEIEERIFGATVTRDETGRKHDWYPMDRIHFTNGGGLPDSRPVRPYSTSIADAWLVVEKLRELEWSTGLTYMSLAGGWAWRCDLHHEDEFDVSDGFAPTAPLAICLAAIQAVGA